ncbi:HAMP domain-containing histidine kinase [bacterium]|nr:HAMP domain-containing histidine kinase [bacterium]
MVVIDEEKTLQPFASTEIKDKFTDLQIETANYKEIFDSVLLLISNEFIKPLTSVKGYMGLLEGSFRDMGEVADKEMRYFRKSMEAINDMEALIRICVQRLRVNKAKQLVGEMKKIRLGDFVDGILGKYCRRPERFINEIDNSIPDVRLRSKYLEIALGNLFSNVEKFGGESKLARVTANLSKDKTLQGEQVLVISIYDYGMGIPEDMTKKVLLPFFKVGASDSRNGLGLGLAMVEDAISFMNGKIDLQSVAGKGTTVIVSVPVMPSDTRTLKKTV